jgi:hypothetical protein
MVQSIAVGLTVLAAAFLVHDPDLGGHHQIRWYTVRALAAATLLFAGYVAAPLFGPEGSAQALLVMSATLWLPQIVVAFALDWSNRAADD